MMCSRIKAGYFVLEGLNAFATTYYLNYLFFYMQERYHFGSAQNLWLGALSGFVYIFGAWQGGQYAQRNGYAVALRLGFLIMTLALLLGCLIPNVIVQLITVVIWTIGVCFIWPSLEAQVTEGESRFGIQRMVGIYNIVWAAFSAVAYFTGGFLLKTIGMSSLYLLPAAIHLLQWAILEWLRTRKGHAPKIPVVDVAGDDSVAIAAAQIDAPRKNKAFLRMAWVANPFAYIAINTVVAIIPSLAHNLHLSIAMAGVFCSIWYFARLIAFVLLWRWPYWHYRFSWLMGAYLSLLISFLVILLVPNLAIIMIAQIFFGLASGLVYYSSLFYSMDVGDTKGEHGGFHEAAIGVGLCLGPALAASAMTLMPQAPQSGAWTVGIILAGGAVSLGWLRLKLRQD